MNKIMGVSQSGLVKSRVIQNYFGLVSSVI